MATVLDSVTVVNHRSRQILTPKNGTDFPVDFDRNGLIGKKNGYGTWQCYGGQSQTIAV
jgi:hypothetical protein